MKKYIFLFLALIGVLSTSSLPTEKKEFNLPEIIKLGIKNNPLISAKLKEIEAKKAAYQASKRLFNPELEFHKGKGKFYDSSIKRNTDGVSLSQYIENPLKRHYRIQMFEKAWQAAENRFDFSKLELFFQIKNFFYKILLLENKEDFAQKNLVSIREIHKLIEKRAKLGEVKELEAIKLYVETLKAQKELNKIQTKLKLAKENLNKFLGHSLPSDFSVSGKLDYKPLAIVEKTLLDKTLLSHPLVKTKEKDLEYAKSNLSYVKWQRFPDFTLSGFIHNELDGKNQGIGISLDIPLWNFKSKEIAEAENLRLKQSEELRALKMEITTEVKVKLNQLMLSEESIRIFHAGLLKQAEESLKISEVSYKQGEISLIDYLDSQRTYYSILKDYQESLYAWNADRAALEKATGGDIK
ncbi:MAG: TolC family protein [Candidatus Aminicenantes bacterium]|nr:MAG: TolC family protein [Candidatus Aminicenantes bacterium]